MNTRHRLIIAASLLGALFGLLLPVSAQHQVDNGLSNPVTVGTGGTGAKTAAGARTNLDVMSTSETGATAAAAVSAHNALSGAHNATALASEAKVASDISTHNLLSGAHNATTLASEAHVATAVGDHAALVQSHGCTTIASEATVTAHTGATTAIHGLAAGVAPVGASGAQTVCDKTLDNDTTVFNGSSTQAFAADEIQADTIRSASGASTAISLSSAGQVTMGRQSGFISEIDYQETIPHNSSVVATFSSELMDNQEEFVPSTGLFTAKESGVYLFVCRGQFPADGDGYRGITFQIDGVNKASVRDSSPSATEVCVINTVAVLYVTSGSVVRATVYQSSGAQMTDCYFTMSGTRLQ